MIYGKPARIYPLQPSNLSRRKTQYQARQHGVKWENLGVGGGRLRNSENPMQIGLDKRPVVLLATNVLGDSVTLGRQVFSKSMGRMDHRTVPFCRASGCPIGRPGSSRRASSYGPSTWWT